jgi:tripartite ATP-independent transporter DctP family solute receptor
VTEFNVFDLPFTVPNEKAADAIFDGPIGAKLATALEAKGIKLLAYYENGFRQLTNSAHPVKSPADLKGLKIRTMQNPIHLEAFRAMGANPTPMPFSEVFTALQQKTIDGQENPIPTIWLSKFYEVQKYVSMTGHSTSAHYADRQEALGFLPCRRPEDHRRGGAGIGRLPAGPKPRDE